MTTTVEPVQIPMALNNLEKWDKLGVEGRAKALAVTLSSLGKQAASMAGWQLDNACQQIAKVVALPGPTGESNELSTQGRGIFLCTSEIEGESLQASETTQVGVVGQVYAALVAGNAVITVGPFGETLADLISGVVPTGIIQNVAGSAQDSLIDSTAIAGVAIISSAKNIITLSHRLAQKEGLLCQLVAEDDALQLSNISRPNYILRFITERTVTINTTAVGGNATLLALGSKED